MSRKLVPPHPTYCSPRGIGSPEETARKGGQASYPPLDQRGLTSGRYIGKAEHPYGPTAGVSRHANVCLVSPGMTRPVSPSQDPLLLCCMHLQDSLGLLTPSLVWTRVMG